MPKIQIKRVYDEASESDGKRILVDRLWPRGVSRERAKLDLWLKEVAPSDELRRWVRNLGGPIQRAFCVHGEPESLAGMKKLLEEEGVREVMIPSHGEKFTL